MANQPKPSRGMPRSLMYALIPGGFVLLVLIMMVSGWWTAETEEEGEATESQLERVQEE